jgi:hypothetical protein
MHGARSEPEVHRPEIARIAFSIARAALNEQHAAVRDLRARTGALLTATSVVVSFLGARASMRSMSAKPASPAPSTTPVKPESGVITAMIKPEPGAILGGRGKSRP